MIFEHFPRLISYSFTVLFTKILFLKDYLFLLYLVDSIRQDLVSTPEHAHTNAFINANKQINIKEKKESSI